MKIDGTTATATEVENGSSIDATTLDEVRRRFGEGKPSQMTFLFYLRMIGRLKQKWWYRDPRTNRFRHLNQGERVLLLTSYNYGKDYQWFISLERLPKVVSSWETKLSKLKPGEDCLIRLPLETQLTWDPGEEVEDMVFDRGHVCRIPTSSSGFRFTESFDIPGTLTVVPYSCIGESRLFVAEIFQSTRINFLREFDREHRKVQRILPEQVEAVPVEEASV